MKKYAKLYNRVFDALHHDDCTVIVSSKNHFDLVALLAKDITEFRAAHKDSTDEDIAEEVMSFLTTVG